MNKEQLIELIIFTAGEIEPISISEQCAESILDDFLKVEQLTLTDVSQRSELLGCEHLCITIKDRDEGVCADCGVEMIRTWQPNCV